MRTKLIVALIIVLAIAGLLARSNALKPKPAPPTTQQIWAKSGTPVQTATIVRGDMEQNVEVTGDISALNSVMLSSKIGGRLASVLVREGDNVFPGQTVAVLDQDDALSNLQNALGGLESATARLSQAQTNLKVTKIETNAAIEQARANLDAALSKLEVAKKPSRGQEQRVAKNRVDSAQANLDNAAANYRRNESLLKEGAISPASFDVIKAQYLVAQSDFRSAKEQLDMMNEGGRAEDISASQSQVAVAREQLRTARANASQNMLRLEDVKSAQAGVRQAQAMVAVAKQQLANTYIKSPITGEVASRTADPGQVVNVGQGLIGVVNLGSIYFRGDVAEKQFGAVAKGQNVRVGIDAFPGKMFAGTITELYPAGSTTNRNFSVRISIPKTNRNIKPGMFARGNIVTGVSRNALLVPKDAIDDRKGTQSVFVVESNVVKRHVISTIRENRDYAEIEMPTDLKAGDVVVTQGRQNLQDGAKVQLTSGQ